MENKMQFMDIKNGRFYLGDCLEVMKEIPGGVVDMLLCLTTQTPASLAEPLRINYAKHGIGLKR